MGTRVGGRLVALAVPVLLGVVACSGSGARPPVAASPAASTTPSPSVAREEGEIVVAARSYYAAVSAAANTGVLAELEAASVPACPCRSVIDFIEGIYAGGERLDRFGYQVGEVSDPLVEGERATLLVTYRLSSYNRLTADGSLVEQFPTEPDTTVRMTLDLVGDRWLVAGIETL